MLKQKEFRAVAGTFEAVKQTVVEFIEGLDPENGRYFKRVKCSRDGNDRVFLVEWYEDTDREAYVLMEE